MGAAISAMLLSAWAVTGELAVPPLAVFAAYVIGSAIVAVRIYRSAIATGRIGLEVDVRLTLPAVEA